MSAGLVYAERQAFLSLEFRYGKSGDPALFEFWRAENKNKRRPLTSLQETQIIKGPLF